MALVTDTRESHFMRLPTEIREMILRYLLVAKYTIREHCMNSKEYDGDRYHIQEGPDQTHTFHTSILRTNRIIREEGTDLCRRENDLVCLTSLRPWCLGSELDWQGLEVIAADPDADLLWNVAMTLTLDPVSVAEDVDDDQRPWKYIFCRDELPTFCRIISKCFRKNHGLLGNTTIHIAINPDIWKEQTTYIDSTPIGLSRMEKLLGPLRQLHSFGTAQVEGPLSGSYKGSIITSLCKDCPTAMEVIQTAMLTLGQGDDNTGEGKLLLANQAYKMALCCVRSCCWLYDERDFVMDHGPFPGLKAHQAKSNLKTRLQARIASVYLKGDMLRMARIYTERAVDRRRPFDRRGYKVYSLELQPWQRPVYAEVLHVSAGISYIHGDVRGAVCDLEHAGEYAPLDEKQESRLGDWRNHLCDRSTKRAKLREIYDRKREDKTRGLFVIACNGKRKGDILLRGGRSEIATSIYETALRKVEALSQTSLPYFNIKSGPFEGYGARDAVSALTFKILAGLTAACLMSRRYKECNEQAQATLERSDLFSNDKHDRDLQFWHGPWDEGRNWVEDQRLDYVRIYYCNAMALKHLGDLSSAKEDMEIALELDPGDGTIHAQLVLLQQELEDGKNEIQSEDNDYEQTSRRKKKLHRKEKAWF